MVSLIIIHINSNTGRGGQIGMLLRVDPFKMYGSELVVELRTKNHSRIKELKLAPFNAY